MRREEGRERLRMKERGRWEEEEEGGEKKEEEKEKDEKKGEEGRERRNERKREAKRRKRRRKRMHRLFPSFPASRLPSPPVFPLASKPISYLRHFSQEEETQQQQGQQ